MGAGTAGSTIHNCNVNLNTAGGSKKQGFPFTLGSPTINRHAIKKSIGLNRHVIYTINQLGGIGRVEWYPQDGVRNRPPYKYVPAAYPRNSNAPTTPPSKHLGRNWNGTPINLNYKGQRPAVLS